RKVFALRLRLGCNILGADLRGQVGTIAPRAQSKKIVPVAVGRLAVTLMADRWSQQAVKPRFGTVQRVGAGAQLLDTRGSPNDRFKNSGKEGAILGEAIGFGGNRHELPLGVELDIAAVAAIDCPVLIEDRGHHAVRIDTL